MKDEHHFYAISGFGCAALLLLILLGASASPLSQGFEFREAPPDQVESSREVSAVHTATELPKSFYDEAYTRSEGVSIPEKTSGLILPHHLLAAPLIAEALQGAAQTNAYEHIVVIGPDHLSRGRANVTVSEAAWQTPYGYLEPDFTIIRRVTQAGGVLDENLFGIEESVPALLPFIKKSFPKARLTGLLVKPETPRQEIARLAEALPNNNATLVIASVDFSHYQTREVALFHDEMSRAVVLNMDEDRVFDLEIDSPESLVFLFARMKKQAAETAVIFAHATSADLSGQLEVAETTSYILASFSEGDSQPFSNLTIMSVGDIMLDRNVKAYQREFGDHYPFEKIRGAESRFFRGYDIGLANLEGAISDRHSPEKLIDFSFDPSAAELLRAYGFAVVSLANNHTLDQGSAGYESTKEYLDGQAIGYFGHQVRDNLEAWTTEVRGRKISFLGFNITDNALDAEEAESAVRGARSQSDEVVVMMHWGAEYVPIPSTEVKRLGRQLIDWGASAVIGAHPHVTQGMEVYQGKPIFWSLGNFIFDQYWSAETQEGMVIGLVLESASTRLYLFPIKSVASQPALARGEERKQLLDRFIGRSDLPDELKAQARRGMLEWSN